jgi:hypothetical protein
MKEYEPLRPGSATFSVTLACAKHNSADISFVANAVDGLVCAGIWGAMASPPPGKEALRLAREILTEEVKRPKSAARFFPYWTGPLLFPEEARERLRSGELFSPSDPMDSALRDGLNSFLRRTLFERNREVYDELFGSARITRLEHRSPLVLEIGMALGIGFLPVALTWGIMWAAASMKRGWEEARIRELERKIREQELEQRILETQIKKRIRDAVSELRVEDIPDAAIAAAAAVSSTAIADLGTSPLVGNITIGLSSIV